MEFTEEMKVNVYPAPLRLQQKTGQVAYRHSHNTMYFIGGTETTFTFYSKKVFKYDIEQKKVSQINNLQVARAGFCTVKMRVSVHGIGLTVRIIFMLLEGTQVHLLRRASRNISTMESK